MTTDKPVNPDTEKTSGLDPELEREIAEKEKAMDTDTFGSDEEERSKMRRIFANNKAKAKENDTDTE